MHASDRERPFHSPGLRWQTCTSCSSAGGRKGKGAVQMPQPCFQGANSNCLWCNPRTRGVPHILWDSPDALFASGVRWVGVH